MENKNVQPIYILPEGTRRETGRSAQANNIMAAKIVGETVRTTLGPKGMDKMLVDELGEVTVTNDGVTILEEMHIEHPAAKMIVEIAKTQEDEVGDGTTTAVVLAGELLKKAEELLEQKIHPTIITKGYRLAAERAQMILNNLAQPCKPSDRVLLKGIATTAMTGKGAENAKETLAPLIIEAVLSIAEEKERIEVDLNNIKIETRAGSSIEDSELIKGIVLDKERVNSEMPKSLTHAKIALIDSALEIKDTETEAKIQITQPEQMQAFLDMEENMLRKMVTKIKNSGATAVFCQKGIDDVAQHFLAKEGIFAVRRVKKSDMQRLAKATGAHIITNLDDLSSSHLGSAGMVEEESVGEDPMIFVKDCVNAKSVTVLVRGSTEHVIDEVKRALEDAMGDLAAALKSGKIVAGAGAPEVELSRHLMKYAESLSGREQLSVKAFAEAMEIIPKTLAENAGLDPIDILVEMKAAHDRGHTWAGINVFTGKVMDAMEEHVIEPLKIKTQAVSSASEVAILILRIDDVIASGPQQSSREELPEM
jgi:thermosome